MAGIPILSLAIQMPDTPCLGNTCMELVWDMLQGVPSVGGFLAGLTLGLKW